MVHMMNKMETSRWWWFDGHDNGSKRSPWLQSTLSELDRKTKAMLRLIEEDADSFAQRAEMYYKKRPELITLVEDFYRAHRSLAERYDQVKSDPGTRLITTLGSPFSSMKYCPEKIINVTNKTYDSCSETFYTEEYAESEIDDPEHEEEVEDPEQEDKYKADIIIKGGNVKKEDGTLLEQVSSEVCNDEVMKLKEELERLKEENKIQKAHLTQKDEEKREVCDDEVTKLKEELERLKEENKIQKAQLTQKDEEKREVIRQLSLAVQVLKDENMELKKSIVKESPRKRRSIEFSKLKEGLFGMLFNGSPKPQASVVAL